MNNSIEGYKKENSIIFIDEFNKAVSKLFKDNDDNVPFVFFRMGEKFKSYFIDEFQDTSKMQWKNLGPLIENALAESSNIVLVGDLKQAIYRWRGGETDIMKIEMKNGEVKNLLGNFRSKKNIIHFNNILFTKVYENDFREETIKQRFKMEDYPHSFSKNDGYVDITHREKREHIESILFEENKLEETILDIEKRGYRRNDIGILVRTIKEGNKIGEYLSSINNPINFISSSSIMMISDPFTDFIINTILYMIDNSNVESFYRMLFLWLKLINKNDDMSILDDITENAENLKNDNNERDKILNKYIPYYNELTKRILSFKY
ncbi:UvrD-helicase domain-containing protein, partial [candidate division WOR-3 bacterium]|nr:UvrD-helicase domain-containing protein [candidate division WOR-3 bacterium]